MQPQNQVESLISELNSKAEPEGFVNRVSAYSGAGCVFNTESAWYFFTSPSFRSYVTECKYIFIDGSALVLALRFYSLRLHRNHGPDVLRAAIDEGNFDSILVLGGNPQSVSMLLASGSTHGIDDVLALPFFHSRDEFALAEKQLSSFFESKTGRRLVLVSLGLPKQEEFTKFMLEGNFVDTTRDLVLPVGAAIDFLTGTRTRGGKLWQRLGLEWLPRLIREPRMIPRVYRSLKAVIAIINYRISGFKR